MTQTLSASVATLWRYPIKSMMGEELNSAEITSNGLEGDRVYALIDTETGNVISAKNPKKWPTLFSFRATTLPNTAKTPTPIWITLPDGEGIRSDQSDLNDKISKSLGRPVALQSQSPTNAKLEQYWPEYEGQGNEVSSEAVAGDAAQGTFFDYSPLHLLTTSSLEALQKHYPEGRFEARRFRPNLMIDTGDAQGFVENDWVGKVIKIGNSLRLQITDPCPRCVMPTLAQGDLPQDSRIFKNAIAKNKLLVPFAGKELPSVGVYALVLSPGRVKRGDILSIEG
jgi:uncharacterized protein